jgi:hypothetical protein
MSQYNRLFNSTRIPKIDCDRLKTNSENIRHIIVIKCDHYYKVHILDKNGQIDSLNYQSIQSSTNDLIEKLEFQFDDQLKNEFDISQKNLQKNISN